MLKKTKEMQILFFCLIPVGIVILIFSMKLMKKTFFGNIILEVPYSQKSADFILNNPGDYSIWHKGQFFRKAPLDKFKPEIIDKSTGLKTGLTSLLLRPNTNNSYTARMELYRFFATAGMYVLELTDGSSISGAENSIIRILPARMVDYDKYFIQIRESRSVLFVITGIVLIVIAGLCMIGGLVLGILADQIF